ncbi:uncharacterized protein SAMN05421788_1044 [Filimonas lacunae]|uniref:TPM domain-containing protein n=1 Tax=Filimonas lacunae TaxID=477680 RepID=A0A173M9Q0_9BACT|nr:TPM domain-containing protein [Filimonas lacunae]BAV04266.1 beta-propeller domains of methanol dehydrogenase type [Filimonas lacunae]SIT13325.1 uncharacterized protein SAMN05421788_1044 [Filimonas lacunae]
MKKQLLYLVLLISISLNVFSQDVLPPPNPARLVVDNANVLSPEQKQILEEKLVALDDSTSNQICIVTIPSLNDYPIEDYAVKLFRSWGIGNKKTNNGVLILVSVQDHKIRIEVGYGLEGAIPDITAGSIIDNDMKPNFKAGDYYRGLDAATTSLSKAAAGEYKAPREKKQGKGKGGSGLSFIIILIIVIVIMAASGGGGGGGRGRGGSILPFLFLGGGGSNWGGGGGGFGGGGGGGFGGFGGGSSGGGGASGSW